MCSKHEMMGGKVNPRLVCKQCGLIQIAGTPDSQGRVIGAGFIAIGSTILIFDILNFLFQFTPPFIVDLSHITLLPAGIICLSFGIIKSLLKRSIRCSGCSSKDTLIPIDSPVGRVLLRQFHESEESPALPLLSPSNFEHTAAPEFQLVLKNKSKSWPAKKIITLALCAGVFFFLLMIATMGIAAKVIEKTQDKHQMATTRTNLSLNAKKGLYEYAKQENLIPPALYQEEFESENLQKWELLSEDSARQVGPVYVFAVKFKCTNQLEMNGMYAYAIDKDLNGWGGFTSFPGEPGVGDAKEFGKQFINSRHFDD